MNKKIFYIFYAAALSFIALLTWRYIEIQNNAARLKALRDIQAQAIIATSTLQLPVTSTSTPTSAVYETELQHKTDMFSYIGVEPNQILMPNKVIKGEARGGWYFEGMFPVELRTGTSTVIWQGGAQAGGNWMTTNFVPFSFTANYTPFGTPTPATLVLRRDNPSGEPINDDELHISVMLQ